MEVSKVDGIDVDMVFDLEGGAITDLDLLGSGSIRVDDVGEVPRGILVEKVPGPTELCVGRTP